MSKKNQRKQFSEKCGMCGHNRWKTVEKKYLWRCRKCGYISGYVKE